MGPGRLPHDDRQALNGVLYVLNTGIAWRDLPQELGYGSRSGLPRAVDDQFVAGQAFDQGRTRSVNRARL